MRTTTIGAIAELYDGPHATPTRTDSGPYFLNISSLNAGRLDLEQSDHVSDEDFEKWTRRVTPRPDDLLFSYETRLGEAALMPEGVQACLGRRMALLRFDPAQVDPRYFLYYYLGPEFRKIIEKHTIHGATVNRLPLKAMPQWEIRLPEVEQQRAIAEVLGALDAKIVANRKLAETTDSFVRALFEEAGARSRERRTVAQLVTNIRETVTPAGVSESSSYVGLEHISRRQMWLSEDGDPADVQSAKSKFQRGDVLFGKLRPYFHKVATATTEGICSTDILVLRPTSDAIRGWALATLTSDEVIAAVVASSEGTRMPRASWKDLSAVQVPWPGESEARAISAQVENLRSIALAAVSECQVLAVTRDALLPNLMSGELRVRDAERFVAQVL